MTGIFLFDKCSQAVLTKVLLEGCRAFSCGSDSDMDDFFKNDAVAYTENKMGKSYCFTLDDDPQEIVACFTVSNDSIRIYDLPSSRKNAMWGITNREKMLSRYPGVLIGRLAVSEKFARKGDTRKCPWRGLTEQHHDTVHVECEVGHTA